MTPEEEQVRRALASAPAPGPMPPEVVARLETVLRDLATTRAAEDDAPAPVPPTAPPSAPPTVAPVVTLADRRPRRWPRVLLAAAAVSALAYAGGLWLTGMPGDAGSESAVTAEAPEDAAGGAGEESAGDLAPAPSAATEEQDSRWMVLLQNGPAELSRDSLAGDVVRLVRRSRAVLGTADGLASGERSDRGTVESQGSGRPGCDLPATGPGDLLAAVRLDDEPATLVVRRATAGARVAEVYSCAGGDRLLGVARIPVRRLR